MNKAELSENIYEKMNKIKEEVIAEVDETRRQIVEFKEVKDFLEQIFGEAISFQPFTSKKSNACNNHVGVCLKLLHEDTKVIYADYPNVEKDTISFMLIQEDLASYQRLVEHEISNYHRDEKIFSLFLSKFMSVKELTYNDNEENDTHYHRIEFNNFNTWYIQAHKSYANTD